MSSTPSALKEPEVPDHLRQHIDAFYTLMPSHLVINGIVQSLSLQELESYCRLFDVYDTEEFIVLMQAMDREYLNYLNKVSK